MNLKYAAPDAKAVTRLFGQRGASVYRKGYVKQLLDKHATRLDRVPATIADGDQSAVPHQRAGSIGSR